MIGSNCFIIQYKGPCIHSEFCMVIRNDSLIVVL